jgi:hypothetical protein
VFVPTEEPELSGHAQSFRVPWQGRSELQPGARQETRSESTRCG